VTVTSQQIIDEARTWIETPFRHQGRIKGRDGAVDCVGLIVGVMHALGIYSSKDVTDYNEQPNPEMMGRLGDQYGIRVSIEEMRPGDVLWLRFIQPQHLAIVTEKNSIIHADSTTAPKKAHGTIGRCVEHTLSELWRRRIIRVYRIPGVDP